MISLRSYSFRTGARTGVNAVNAQAVTTIPFWHSMEGELGKEVDSLAQRFNAGKSGLQNRTDL